MDTQGPLGPVRIPGTVTAYSRPSLEQQCAGVLALQLQALVSSSQALVSSSQAPLETR